MDTATMHEFPTHELARAGQSPWLDSISRGLLRSGELKGLIREKGLLGVTSNPTIFEKAITTAGGGYEKDIKTLFRKGSSTLEVYDAITVSDIQAACDLFGDVFTSSYGEHGFVSLEVRPDLAHDEKKTVADALRLFSTVNRPNVMIKVPATPEGVRAFRELTASGVNVNVTLIFSRLHYRDVLAAYIDGLELYKKRGGDVSGVHSVASVFVSRFDSVIDKQLGELALRETDEEEKQGLASLKAKAAIANAKIIYQEFKKETEGARWKKLAQEGANVQKVLWGSTSVKNPEYHDLMYVETLVGTDTVNTMPAVTLEAYLDHGKTRPGAVEENIEEAYAQVETLKSWGIDLEETGRKLQHDGLLAFVASFDALMSALESFRKPVGIPAGAKFKIFIPKKAAAEFPWMKVKAEKWVERFYKYDPSIWKDDEKHHAVINNRLGWLKIVEKISGALYEIDELEREIRREKIKDVVLLGMGGSSLAPEVMNLICERRGKLPRFHVLDTTDPASIYEVEKKIAIKSSVFIAASKSGTTVETTSQYRYFYAAAVKAYGKVQDREEKAGRHFVAITDDGSRLETEAYEKHFRKVFINPTDIGGRYSALSFFGLVPAALIGIDIRILLSGAKKLLAESREEKDPQQNNPFALGVILGALASQGNDKLTLWATKKLSPFGAWLEQLIAESTGKEEIGILPVDGDSPADLSVYGNDRVFLVLKEAGKADKRIDAAVAAVRKKGFPVIISEWKSGYDLGAEFLRWEIITAISSATLGINPFDEPNVKESKDNTTRILTLSEKDGTSAVKFNKLQQETEWAEFFEDVKPGSYAAILAYIKRSPETAKALASIQALIRDKLGIPVTVGFGPRYLHSIGQFYKGGPQTGRFMVLVDSAAKDLKIPDAKFSFSQLKRAQAAGDCQAFSGRGLPLMALDLGKDPVKGLAALEKKLKTFFQAKP